jgi:hypothetical protein
MGGDRPWEPVLAGEEHRVEEVRVREQDREEEAGLPARGDREGAEALVSELAERTRAATPRTSTPVARQAPRGGAPGNLFVLDIDEGEIAAPDEEPDA